MVQNGGRLDSVGTHGVSDAKAWHAATAGAKTSEHRSWWLGRDETGIQRTRILLGGRQRRSSPMDSGLVRSCKPAGDWRWGTTAGLRSSIPPSSESLASWPRAVRQESTNAVGRPSRHRRHGQVREGADSRKRILPHDLQSWTSSRDWRALTTSSVTEILHPEHI